MKVLLACTILSHYKDTFSNATQCLLGAPCLNNARDTTLTRFVFLTIVFIYLMLVIDLSGDVGLL